MALMHNREGCCASISERSKSRRLLHDEGLANYAIACAQWRSRDMSWYELATVKQSGLALYRTMRGLDYDYKYSA
jgi:hypothetical protein